MIMMYQDYIRSSNSSETSSHCKISRSMGYIANVNDAKEILEKIFNSN